MKVARTVWTKGRGGDYFKAPTYWSSYMRWEEIAIELEYGIDNVFRLHRNALDEIKIPKNNTVKSSSIQ